MINIKQAKLYCIGDITQIENYEKAINDKTQTWYCHHIKETDEWLSRKQLIELGLYYNRPPSDLMFLTRSEHMILHHMCNQVGMNGKHHTEETKQKISESLKGRVCPMKGKHHSEETKQKMSEALKGRRPSNLDAILEHQKLYGGSTKGKHRVYDNKELKIYHYE